MICNTVTPPSTPCEPPELTADRLDALFAALADERRRRVLRYFHETTTDSASVTTLVDAVAERSDAPREAVEATLHHNALPALADRGIVEYDPPDGAVRYCGSPAMNRILTAAVELDMLTD